MTPVVNKHGAEGATQNLKIVQHTYPSNRLPDYKDRTKRTNTRIRNRKDDGVGK